jgi:hypothetical protein
MNTQQFLAPVLRTIASVPQIRTISRLEATDVLGWVGLTTRRSRLPATSALVAAGALIGAAAALLLTPSSGRALRTRLGRRTGGTVGRQLGKIAGAQFGGHPVATTRVIRGAAEVFPSK